MGDNSIHASAFSNSRATAGAIAGMEGREMAMKKAPVGWLAVGAIGASINAAIYLSPAVRESGGAGWVIGVLEVAGFLGILLMPRLPWPGGFLVFAGICPNLLALLFILPAFPSGLLMAWVLLPAAMMVVGAWNLAGREASNETDEAAPAGTRLRCERCGVTYVPYDNAWNRAGFCSRKCLLSAR